MKNKEQRDGEESSYWVLFVLINPGSITGGSANWYVIGTFGRENGYLTDKLVFKHTHKYLNIFDYGKDFYAMQIYFVNPDSDEELKEGYDTLTLIPWQQIGNIHKQLLLIHGEVEWEFQENFI